MANPRIEEKSIPSVGLDSALRSNFASLLNQKMSEAGLNQSALAHKLRIDQGTISKVLRGQQPSKRIFSLLSDFFDLSQSVADLSDSVPTDTLKVGFHFGLPALSLLNMFNHPELTKSKLCFYSIGDSPEFEINPDDLERLNDDPIPGTMEAGRGRFRGHAFLKYGFYQRIDDAKFLGPSNLEKQLLSGDLDVIISPDIAHHRSDELFAAFTVALSQVREEVFLVMVQKRNPSKKGGIDNLCKFVFPASSNWAEPKPKPKKYDLIFERDSIASTLWEESLTFLASDEIRTNIWELQGRADFLSEFDTFVRSKADSADTPIFLLLSEPKLAWLEAHVNKSHKDFIVKPEAITKDSIPNLDEWTSNYKAYKAFVRKDRLLDSHFVMALWELGEELSASTKTIAEKLKGKTVDILRDPFIKMLAYTMDMDLMYFITMAKDYHFEISVQMAFAKMFFNNRL